MKRVGIIALALALLFSFACAETLTLYGGRFSSRNIGYKEFCEMHPDVEPYWPSDVYYYPASALITALLTGEFKCDIINQDTDEADWKTLMSKGYCADLSGSNVLKEAVELMHPKIAEQGMLNGHLYAIPVRASFDFWCVNEDTWTGMGYTMEDVPQSFKELLQFLTAWCDRLEDEPEAETVAFGGWEGAAKAPDYTIQLTEMLVNEVTMQKQFADETLEFDVDELAPILEECAEIGSRLAQVESKDYSATLFERIMGSFLWPESSEIIVYLRIRDDEPKLIKSKLRMWAVFAGSDQVELATELLEKAAVGMTDPAQCDDLFIYANAEPRIKYGYEEDLAYWGDLRDKAAKLLENEDLSVEMQETLQEELDNYTQAYEWTKINKWMISPEQIGGYQQIADRLYYAPLNVFDSSAAGYDKIQEVMKPFGYGKESARQMLGELNSVANMMRLEQ